MSTGDSSEFIRKKMSERGIGLSQLRSPVKFMRDGFDAWAESERPFRGGGVEKVAAEKTSLRPDEIVMRDVERKSQDKFSQMQKGSKSYLVNTGGRLDPNYEDLSGTGFFEDLTQGLTSVFDPSRGLTKETIATMDVMPGTKSVDEYGMTADIGRGKHSKPRKPRSKSGGNLYTSLYNPDVVSVNDYGIKSVDDYEKMMVTDIGRGKHSKPRKPRSKSGGNMFTSLYDTSSMDYLTKAQKADEDKALVQHEKMMADANKMMAMPRIGGAKSMTAQLKDAVKNVFNKVKSAKPPSMTGTGKGKSARAEIVKKVMREKNLSLPAASKFVKEHGLY